MSGMTKISSQRSSRIRSASGVVGPLAPSARMRHFELAGVFRVDHAIDRARNKHIARQGEELVRIDMVVLGERPQIPLLDHVLLGRFDVDPFRIVNRGGVIADPDDFDAALVARATSAATEPTLPNPCTIAVHFSGSIFNMFIARSIR